MPSGAYAFGEFSMTQRASDLAFDDFRDVGTGYGDRPIFRTGVPWQDAEAVMSDGDAFGREGEGWPELLQELADDLGDRRTSADERPPRRCWPTPTSA